MSDPELDELKREFLAEAQEKVNEISATIEARSSENAVDRLIYLAHQLKGSGGSYGFQRISTDAAELEKALEREKLGDGADDQIRQHAKNLRAEVERAIKELR